jgi:hypothetical protein
MCFCLMSCAVASAGSAGRVVVGGAPGLPEQTWFRVHVSITRQDLY